MITRKKEEKTITHSIYSFDGSVILKAANTSNKYI